MYVDIIMCIESMITIVFCARSRKQQKCSIQEDCYNRSLVACSSSFLGSKAYRASCPQNFDPCKQEK